MKAFRRRFTAFGEHFGLDRLLLIHITFREPVRQPSEANRIWHSLATNLVNKRYDAWFRIMGVGEDGKLHFHVVVVLPQPTLKSHLLLTEERKFWCNRSGSHKNGRVSVEWIGSFPKVMHYLLRNLNQVRAAFPRSGVRFATASGAAGKLFRDRSLMAILAPLENFGRRKKVPKTMLPATLTL